MVTSNNPTKKADAPPGRSHLSHSMVCLSRATPAFILTLVATILLAVVVFCVPYVKTVYFLKAAVNYQTVSGTITFGTLGYCVQLPGGTTCSKPSIGYQLGLDI